MDKLFLVLVDALKKEKATPSERCIALVRAGAIAQAYVLSDEDTMNQVFGSDASALL